MTVMFHLAEKGLLHRHQQNRKTYIYTIAQTREEFLDRVAARMVEGLVDDFGDRALAQFRRKLDETHVPTDGQAAVVHTPIEQPTVH
jgi:predicted transcriptional regulator